MEICFFYIDPGTGSLLISLVTGAAMTLLYSLKGWYQTILSLITNRRLKNKNDFSNSLVFFSEGSNYWSTFKPVLDALNKKGVDYKYLTADNSDPALQNDEYPSYYIGPMNKAFFFLNSMTAKMCVMTTPQLNILNLKRSKSVLHYCYLAHAPMDVHANKLFSFDYFDSVLCGNDFHIENLRYLEGIRGTKPKLLKKVGCTYYDYMLNESCPNNTPKSILLAPTWGDRSFLKKYGVQIIELLLNNNHRVILRPHPQSWISDQELINNVIQRFKTNNSFVVDQSNSNTDTLLDAKVIICDITSGIIYDFALLFRRPVIGIYHDWQKEGYEAHFLKTKSCAEQFLNHYGAIIDETNIDMLPSAIDSILDSSLTTELVENHVNNFGLAGEVAAATIIDISNDLCK